MKTVLVFIRMTLVFWLKVVMIEWLHYWGGNRRLVEEIGNSYLLCLLWHVLTHLSMKWAMWFNKVTHCFVAFIQCTETCRTVSESSSSSGSLSSNSCLMSASVGMGKVGFSCLSSVDEKGDFYIVFEMPMWA